MTDLRKAAEMALETLQYTCDYLPAKSGVERDVDYAITALRQALAQSENEERFSKDWQETVARTEAKLKEKNV